MKHAFLFWGNQLISGLVSLALAIPDISLSLLVNHLVLLFFVSEMNNEEAGEMGNE